MQSLITRGTAASVDNKLPLGTGTQLQLQSREQIEEIVADFKTTVVPHTGYMNCVEALQTMRLAGRTGRGGPRGMLITGESGAGKSTMAKTYEALFPRVEEDERTLIPVLRIQTPGQPTAKEIGAELLRRLNDPFPELGSAEVRLARAHSLAEKCGVEMIIFDEVQHLFEGLDKRHRRIASNSLKNFMNSSEIPCVLIGTNDCITYLLEDKQLARRCSPKLELKGFSLGTDSGLKEFKRALLSLDTHLPMTAKSDLVNPQYTTAIYLATDGLIGNLMNLLEGALRRALISGAQRLTVEHFAEQFSNVIFPKCEANRNPFDAQFNGVPLAGVGEPFYRLDA